jgi:hypothetical protein
MIARKLHYIYGLLDNYDAGGSLNTTNKRMSGPVSVGLKFEGTVRFTDNLKIKMANFVRVV